MNKLRVALLGLAPCILLLTALGMAAHVKAQDRAALRLNLRVNAYGVQGSGTIIVDPATGWFVRRFVAGPASESEGWDGAHAWRGDATGMPRVQSDAGEIHEIVGWSQALKRALQDRAAHASSNSSQDTVAVAFTGFSAFGRYHIPSVITAHSTANGNWYADVTHVERVGVTNSMFAPPQVPHDSAIIGSSTTVPIHVLAGTPSVDVRVNGRTLKMYLDSGGQNVLSDSAAKRIGLTIVGNASVSGGGGVAATRFATAQRVQVGNATMYRQPYLILPDSALAPADGIIGYEMFARYAAKVDAIQSALTLAKTDSVYGQPEKVATMGYIDRQPELNGAIDAIRGKVTLDTGSSFTAQVSASTVATHELVNTLHARITVGGRGVGGRYPLYMVRAHSLVVGPASIGDPLLYLLTKPGIWNGRFAPISNIGFATLRRWILIFDYPDSRIQLRPGGDDSGNTVHDHSGIILGVKGSRLIAASVLGGTPAWNAGVRDGDVLATVDGKPVTAADFRSIRHLLRGSPGQKVTIAADGHAPVAIVLEQYL